jgi:hypothetical protein
MNHCDNCLYWARIPTSPSQDGAGQCRFRAPIMRRVSDNDPSGIFRYNEERALWPRSSPEDFCGEWAERPGNV